MLRISILTASALILAGFGSARAMAEDIGPRSKDYIEGKCNEAGGTYWDAGASWGCGYKGGGGVICDEGGGTDEQGRPIGRWCEETTRTNRGDSKGNWGLAGLLGLVGLAGLAIRQPKRDKPPEVTPDR